MKVSSEELGVVSAKLVVYLRDRLENSEIEIEWPLAPLRGGFQTLTCRFTLKRVGGNLAEPLVLRLYPPDTDPDLVVFESAVQNALAGEGLPVAKVHFLCTDVSVLGGIFFVMDLLPGQSLWNEPTEVAYGSLGRAHSELHQIRPQPVIEALDDAGIDRAWHRHAKHLLILEEQTNRFPFMGEIVDWLIEHRPPKTERLSICHGDFHIGNLLHLDNKLTGIVDWPGFLIADPLIDVAATMTSITIIAKHLANDSRQTRQNKNSLDREANLKAEEYLAAYQAHQPKELAQLDYYRVQRCANCLSWGMRGLEICQRPSVVQDFVDYIRKYSGIEVSMPV